MYEYLHPQKILAHQAAPGCPIVFQASNLQIQFRFLDHLRSAKLSLESELPHWDLHF